MKKILVQLELNEKSLRLMVNSLRIQIFVQERSIEQFNASVEMAHHLNKLADLSIKFKKSIPDEMNNVFKKGEELIRTADTKRVKMHEELSSHVYILSQLEQQAKDLYNITVEEDEDLKEAMEQLEHE